MEMPAPGEAVPFDFGGVRGRVRLRVDPMPRGLSARARVRAQHDARSTPPGWSAPRRCSASLLSTHVVVEAPEAGASTPRSSTPS